VGEFDGKVALVTGGSTGIGRASALAFASAGAKVVIADIDKEGGEETLAMVRKANGEAIFIRTDVSDGADVEALVEQTVKVYDRLDFGHNNAAIEGIRALTADYTEAGWDRVMNVNLKGVWLCMKFEIPQMLKQGGGVIVNTSSFDGLRGHALGLPAYIASKHGVIGLTKATALEYASLDIRVNAVCPRNIFTPMIQRFWDADPALKAQSEAVPPTPLGRWGSPEDIAEVVVWLCSNASSFVTGQAISVDGGWTAC
jgi:NAD(P)-dependent dehydrogenase (short-subunit alcohol dehydrogenase family)